MIKKTESKFESKPSMHLKFQFNKFAVNINKLNDFSLNICIDILIKQTRRKICIWKPKCMREMHAIA